MDRKVIPIVSIFDGALLSVLKLIERYVRRCISSYNQGAVRPKFISERRRNLPISLKVSINFLFCLCVFSNATLYFLIFASARK